MRSGSADDDAASAGQVVPSRASEARRWRVLRSTGLEKHTQPRVTSQHPGEHEATGSTIARGTLGTCLGSPEVLGAFHADDRIKRTGHGCFGHPAFRAPSFKERVAGMRITRAQTRRENGIAWVQDITGCLTFA